MLVDDVHWLDGSSAQALLFAARRLIADPIAVVLAVRAGEPSLLDGADLPTLALGGLDREAAARSLLGAARRPPARRSSACTARPAATRWRCSSSRPTGRDLARAAGGARCPCPARLARAPSCAGSTRCRSGRARALLLAAASDSGDLAVLARAAARSASTSPTLAAAEEAGLVHARAPGAVAFRHPLVRSASTPRATPASAARRTARSPPRCPTATSTGAPGTSPRRRSAPTRRRPRRSSRPARAAAARSAYAVAAAAFERARAARAGRRAARALLCAAADAAWLAGLASARWRCSTRPCAAPADPALAARIEHLRGTRGLRRGPVMDGHAILVAAAAAAADPDPRAS